MRPLIVSLALALAGAPAMAAASAEGVWLVQDKDAKVRIGPCPARADRLCGEIVWLQEPRDEEGQIKHDAHNPDPKLRGRPIIGLPMIRDFRAAGAGRWDDGVIYDPRSGRSYRSRMRLMPDGELRVDGCVAMFCQGETWRRTG